MVRDRTWPRGRRLSILGGSLGTYGRVQQLALVQVHYLSGSSRAIHAMEARQANPWTPVYHATMGRTFNNEREREVRG